MPRLAYMGDPHIVDDVRCRVYGGEDEDDRRAAFVERLAAEGVVDCPAYDGWVAALQVRGWLPKAPGLEPNPDGPGKIGRWRLTDVGLKAWREVRS
jgi:hypothetical protein